MKKLLIIFALVSVRGFAQAATLTPSGPASYSGTAPVVINANYVGNAPSALLFSWTATGPVSAINVGAAASAATKQIVCGGTFPQGSGNCIIYGVNTNSINAGAVVAIATETIPSSGPVSFTIVAAQAVDANGTAIATTGGTVTIPLVVPISKCDLNADGAINAADVTIIAQRVTASPVIVPCDFNGDGKCDLSDFWVILKAALLGGTCTAP